MPAIEPADREVSGVALAVEGAITFLATEARKIIHGVETPGWWVRWGQKLVTRCLKHYYVGSPRTVQ